MTSPLDHEKCVNPGRSLPDKLGIASGLPFSMMKCHTGEAERQALPLPLIY